MHVRDNRNACITWNQGAGIAIGMNTSYRHNRHEYITNTTGMNTPHTTQTQQA